MFEIFTESYDACEEGTLHHSDVDHALGMRMSADTSNIVSPMTHAEVNVSYLFSTPNTICVR